MRASVQQSRSSGADMPPVRLIGSLQIGKFREAS
jgi:hypothetical protein